MSPTEIIGSKVGSQRRVWILLSFAEGVGCRSSDPDWLPRFGELHPFERSLDGQRGREPVSGGNDNLLAGRR